MTENPNQDARTANGSITDLSTAENGAELIKVVDRKGNVKLIPRSEYARKKKSRKKRTHRKFKSAREIVSVTFIVIVMAIAAYFAIKIVQ